MSFEERHDTSNVLLCSLFRCFQLIAHIILANRAGNIQTHSKKQFRDIMFIIVPKTERSVGLTGVAIWKFDHNKDLIGYLREVDEKRILLLSVLC